MIQATSETSSGTAKDPQVLITRTIRAPRDVVFDAWSDAAGLAQWYAPEGCSIRFPVFEFRQGGGYHSCIRTPSGYECWCVGSYREISRPDRIVFTMIASDADGHPRDPVDLGMRPDWPRETVVTVTFVEHEEGTLLTLQQTVSESLAKETGAYPSWLQMLDNLAATVERR